MVNRSPDEPGAHWFHENTLSIKGDKASLSKVPACTLHGKKWISASDGGYYRDEGRVHASTPGTFLDLHLVSSEYGPRRVDAQGSPLPPPPPHLAIHRLPHGALLIGGVTYRPKRAGSFR